MSKRVWVKNKNTSVKYLIEEEWYLKNTNDFELTAAPVEEEVVEKPKAKTKVVKKAKVTKKVLVKDKK